VRPSVACVTGGAELYNPGHCCPKDDMIETESKIVRSVFMGYDFHLSYKESVYT
jgi:hypothetical protein